MPVTIGRDVVVVLERGRRNENLLERFLADIETLAGVEKLVLNTSDRNTDSVFVALSDARVPLHVAAHPVEKLDCG